jgi:hypothetical protein
MKATLVGGAMRKEKPQQHGVGRYFICVGARTTCAGPPDNINTWAGREPPKPHDILNWSHAQKATKNQNRPTSNSLAKRC